MEISRGRLNYLQIENPNPNHKEREKDIKERQSNDIK